MRDIRQCSGPWKGLWIQFPVRGAMRMTLTFQGCRVLGGGKDQDGAFSIVGEYEPETQELRLLKSYPTLRVLYEGTWNGSYVAGTSTIAAWPLVDYGSFELWPESEEVAVETAVGQEELVSPLP